MACLLAVNMKGTTFYGMTSCTVLFVGESVWKELSASIFRLKVVGFFYLSYRGAKDSSKYCLLPTHYLIPEGNMQNINSLKNLSCRQILFGLSFNKALF